MVVSVFGQFKINHSSVHLPTAKRKTANFMQSMPPKSHPLVLFGRIKIHCFGLESSTKLP